MSQTAGAGQRPGALARGKLSPATRRHRPSWLPPSLWCRLFGRGGRPTLECARLGSVSKEGTVLQHPTSPREQRQAGGRRPALCSYRPAQGRTARPEVRDLISGHTERLICLL